MKRPCFSGLQEETPPAEAVPYFAVDVSVIPGAEVDTFHPEADVLGNPMDLLRLGELYLCLFVCLCVSVCVIVCVCLSDCVSVIPGIQSIPPEAEVLGKPWVPQSSGLSGQLSFCLSVCLSVFVCLPVCQFSHTIIAFLLLNCPTGVSVCLWDSPSHQRLCHTNQGKNEPSLVNSQPIS